MKEDDVHIHKLGTSGIKKAIAELSRHVVRTDYRLPGEVVHHPQYYP
jgi:hypothetical protein